MTWLDMGLTLNNVTQSLSHPSPTDTCPSVDRCYFWRMSPRRGQKHIFWRHEIQQGLGTRPGTLWVAIPGGNEASYITCTLSRLLNKPLLGFSFSVFFFFLAVFISVVSGSSALLVFCFFPFLILCICTVITVVLLFLYLICLFPIYV